MCLSVNSKKCKRALNTPLPEDLPAVVLAESAPRHDLRDPVRSEEDVHEVVHRRLEGLVSRDLSLALQEALQ